MAFGAAATAPGMAKLRHDQRLQPACARNGENAILPTRGRMVGYLPLKTPLDVLRNRSLERLTYEAGQLELTIAERDINGIVRTATVTFAKIIAFEVFDES